LSADTAAIAIAIAIARADARARTWLRALVVLTVLALSACTTAPLKPVPLADPPVVATTPPPMPVVPAPAPPPPEVLPAPEALARDPTQGLLRFHERMRELPAPELAREITLLDARLEARSPTNPTNPASPPGALAAAQPASGAASSPPAGRDTGSADPQLSLELALLLALQRQNGDLARALSLVEPLQRAGAPAATQPLARLLYSRLAEQRRLEEQLERQAQTVRELQRRADQLAAQLEALRAIERSLNTRPSMPVTSGTPGVSGSPGGGVPTPAPR